MILKRPNIITHLLRAMLCGALLCCGFNLRAANDFVLVLDAGHGGHDYGAIGTFANEKSINLAVTKLVGERIKKELNGVKVVYTRDDDYFVSLKRRADIANESKGDLFVSIHVNSVDKNSKNRTTVSGASVYTLGLHRTESNLEVAKRENSVMSLEKDYSTTYQGFDPASTESYIIFEMSQSKHMEHSISLAKEIKDALVSDAGRRDMGVKQAGFWVLWATSMPSVLVELDFICNPESEKYLASEEGQQQMADAIFKALKGYRSSYDRELRASSQSVKPSKKERQEEEKMLKEKDEKQPKSAQAPKDTKRVRKPTLVEATPAVINDNNGSEPIAEEQADDTNPVYRVQFLINRTQLEKGSRQFKGLYPVWSYLDNGIWKYTYGETATWNEAEKTLNQIKDKFPDAFIIKTIGNKRAK